MGCTVGTYNGYYNMGCTVGNYNGYYNMGCTVGNYNGITIWVVLSAIITVLQYGLYCRQL